MKTEILSETKIRYTADEGKWLTRSAVEEGKESLRRFSRVIYTPHELSLVEFTDEQKAQWETDYPRR